MSQDFDFNEFIKACNECGTDWDRVFSAALVGNESKPYGMQTLHIKRGDKKAYDSLEAKYNIVREALLKGMEANPPWYNAQPGYDIGPKEQAWFVLCDDCLKLDPPLRDEHNRLFYDEWNWLMNGNAGEIWNNRKISFAELVKKVNLMTVMPPDPAAKYHWYDRIT